MAIDPRFTTTAFQFDGYQVTQSLGVVRGITVRSRSVFGTVGAKFQTIFGRRLSASCWFTPKSWAPMPSSAFATMRVN
jgi:uncharacterized protein YbjQ (UPF0145 family)